MDISRLIGCLNLTNIGQQKYTNFTLDTLNAKSIGSSLLATEVPITLAWDFNKLQHTLVTHRLG